MDLRSGVVSEVTLALDRAVFLDSIRVVARRARYREFERRANHRGFGTYLRDDEITRMGGSTVADIIRQLPGWTVVDGGYASTILPPGRGITSLSDAGLGGPTGSSRITGRRCSVNVVIDGMEF